MTYFHINLEPRGQKKKMFCRQFLYPWVPFGYFLLVLLLLTSGFQRCVFREECGVSAPEGGPPLGVWFRLCWPAKPPVIRGWASVFFCLYSDFRCSVLTPVLHQRTPTECVNQGIHPRLPVCPQCVCCRVGHVLTCFIYNSVVLFSSV